MTLVIVARAQDGVVVATDKRDFEPASYLYNDRATKQRRLDNKVVAFSGSAQWIEGLLDLHAVAIKQAGDAEGAAMALQAQLTVNTPDALICFADHGRRLVVVTRSNIGGARAWAAPLLYQQPYIVDGFHSPIARAMFHRAWTSDLDVDEVAALAIAAIKATAAVSVTVSPTFDLGVVRSEGAWSDEDARAAEARAEELMRP